MIGANLNYDSENKRWVAGYPWLKDPSELPNNYDSALATLKSTEKRLRDLDWSKKYNEQIEDMVVRDVAAKLSQEEMDHWNGPVFYISHLAVRNPKSKSTPVRIVFNSSQKFQGVSLNSYLAKGPDAYVNNLIGLLLRWREESVALVGDIRKMYNSIYVGDVERHCHRFLWRNLEDREPDVYAKGRVNMGDRPASAISTEAIYLTAELFRPQFPRVAELLRSSTYVDDVVDSCESIEEATGIARNASTVLKEA